MRFYFVAPYFNRDRLSRGQSECVSRQRIKYIRNIDVMEVIEVAVDKSKKISERQAIFFANKGAIVLVLTMLVLLVYAVAGYADPKLISNSDNYLFRTLYDQLQSLRTDYTNIQSSKGFDVTAIDAVQTATATF